MPPALTLPRQIRFSAQHKLLAASLAFFTLVNPALASNFGGYLIDRACAEGLKHESKNVDSQVQRHTTVCALSADCSEAGYSLYKDGKFIDLDSKGNALAKTYFQTSKRKDGHFVTVTGDLKRDVLATTAIKEAPPPALP
jgi:hypothetical protein